MKWVGGGVVESVLMHWTLVVKKELSPGVKLLIYRSVYVLTLTHGRELWVVTERTRLQVQMDEMRFPHGVAGLRDGLRNSELE